MGTTSNHSRKGCCLIVAALLLQPVWTCHGGWKLHPKRCPKITIIEVAPIHLMTRDQALSEGIGKDGKRCVMADGSPCKRRSGRPDWRVGQGSR